MAGAVRFMARGDPHFDARTRPWSAGRWAAERAGIRPSLRDPAIPSGLRANVASGWRRSARRGRAVSSGGDGGRIDPVERSAPAGITWDPGGTLVDSQDEAG